MKSFFLSVAIAVLPFSVSAETTTYACQYTASAGLVFEDEQWISSQLKVEAPFFLKADNERLDPASIFKGVNIGADHALPACVLHQSYYEIESCSSNWGQSLVFNHETMMGAVSRIYDAAWDDDFDSESLGVSTFFCQAM